MREFAALEFARCGGQPSEKWYALIREHHYDAIIADYPLNLEFDLFAAIARHYQLYSTIRYGDEELPERRRALAPKSGAFTRPTYYWIPREELGQSRIPAGGSR
ncbi:hypothetical protein HS125_06820 [bacterium]|nr:hypothetical protein [bacterium]